MCVISRTPYESSVQKTTLSGMESSEWHTCLSDGRWQELGEGLRCRHEALGLAGEPSTP